MSLERIRAKSMASDLEVEDLLGLARDATVSGSALRNLSKELGWPSTSSGKVPFAHWAETVARFRDDGYQGLRDLISVDPDAWKFVLGLVEQLREHAGAILALEIGAEAEHRADFFRAAKAASVLNQLLCFEPSVSFSDDELGQVTPFLHRLLEQELAPAQAAGVICALRAAGNYESLDILRKRTPLGHPWSGVEKAARAAIMKRLSR